MLPDISYHMLIDLNITNLNTSVGDIIQEDPAVSLPRGVNGTVVHNNNLEASVLSPAPRRWIVDDHSS